VKKHLGLAVLVIATFTLLIVGPLTAFAATVSPTANGYRISPVRTDVTISPGASETVTVYIQNASSAVEDIQVIIDDFEAPTNETGYPELLLNGATAPQHSLKQFTSVPVSTFILQPNEQKSVGVIVSIPKSAPSGGYYGAIRFAPVGQGTGKNVELSASVASLVLVTVPGNLVEQLSISSFGVVHGNSVKPRSIFFSNKNLQAVVSFQNSGNIQEQPFGKVSLKRGSTILETDSVNNAQLPGNVLPDSARRFTVTLDKVGWFGKYKAEGNFGYGSKGQLLTAQATFYVIPVLVIILVILAVLLVLFLIFGVPRLIRRYNRRVIARANRRH
jgi:hypothetical protein